MRRVISRVVSDNRYRYRVYRYVRVLDYLIRGGVMLYVWKCDKCEKETEVLRSLADIDVGPDDPCCGTYTRIIPQLATPGIRGFVLNGAGWERDGYRSRNDSEKGKK